MVTRRDPWERRQATKPLTCDTEDCRSSIVVGEFYMLNTETGRVLCDIEGRGEHTYEHGHLLARRKPAPAGPTKAELQQENEKLRERLIAVEQQLDDLLRGDRKEE